MTAPEPRPRVVEAAFWTWLAAAVLLVLGGMLWAMSPSSIPILFRGVGALFAISGFAIGYLAGRTRQGDKRFRRATIALTLALIVLVTLFAFVTRSLLLVLTLIALITAAILATRPAAEDWFKAVEQPPGGGND